jgi:hypothetical protein
MNITIPKRLMLLRATLVISLTLSVLLSLPLWGGFRSFPVTPVVPTEIIPKQYHIFITVLALLLLTGSLIFKYPRILIFLSILLFTLMVVMGINRLQFWLYVYIMMLWVFVFYNGRVDDSNKYTTYFISLQVVVASVYFFTGLSQLNPYFVDTDFTELISPIRSFTSERQFLFFKKAGYFVPYLLMIIGLGLIIKPVRYLAVTFGVLIHFILIIFLFPSSKNLNYALWLSNLSFIAMIFILFSGKTKQSYFSPTFLFQVPMFYVVTVLFVIMPWLNRRDRWPDVLSFNILSGNNLTARITLSPAVYQKLPSYERSFCKPIGPVYELDHRQWCLHEMHSEYFYSKAVFNSIYSHLQTFNKGGDVKEIELNIDRKPKLLRKP